MKNPDDSNKNIDEQLVEEGCSITSDDDSVFYPNSDDDSEFYPSSKECDTGSQPINENDEINTLTGSLNDLTISASVNSDISNPTVLNTILPKVRSTVLCHNTDQNSWNKALIIRRAGKAKGKNNSCFNIEDITQGEHVSIDFSKIKGWKTSKKKY